MFVAYQLITGVIFWLSFPLLLLLVLVTGKHRSGLNERLGLYRPAGRKKSSCRIWVHAASVGEVKAAGVIIDRIGRSVPDCSFVLTTMTLHGRNFARSYLPGSIPCYLAPLDIPIIADRVISLLRPDLYVCLETELWPLLIGKLKRRETALVLLNGRISDKSVKSYLKLRPLFSSILSKYDKIGAISAKDRDRFMELGANPEVITVTGNIKHDTVIPDNPEDIKQYWSEKLDLPEYQDVFVAGSTHAPEERLLLPLYRKFSGDYGQIWLIAPRHLDRLPEIEKMLAEQGVAYDRLSQCLSGVKRTTSLVLIDTMGNLGELYSIAEFALVGGSLTDYGGHNVMEAAAWGNVVFFGAHVQDFEEAAVLLESVGGGFKVSGVEELERKIILLANDREALQAAGAKAAEAARGGQEAAKAQAELVREALAQSVSRSASTT